RPVELGGGRPTAVESSPTVAYLDGPHKPPSIIVGAGSSYVSDENGGLVVFSTTGRIRFVFRTRDVFNEWTGSLGPSGYDNAVFSTPAVGDLTGDGQQDIVFGSWDHEIYALTPEGTLVPGFPIDNEDTIWSSPALYHVRGRGRGEDLLIGGDASGRSGCYGGFLMDYSYTRGAPHLVWEHCEAQTIWSSPAVGPIGKNGKPVVVVGTGFGERPPYKQGTDDVYAFYAATGDPVPGWPVTTAGPVFGSPAIGTLPGSPTPAVVDTSWCVGCPGPAPGVSMVYAWSGSGSLLWSQTLEGAQDFASPILVDLSGDGSNDVLVGSSAGLFPLDGTTGSFLFQTSETKAINNCSVQNSPAVAEVASSWQLLETCGGPQQVAGVGRVFDYPLPATPGTLPPWPMWRGEPAHDGVPATVPVASTTAPSTSVPTTSTTAAAAAASSGPGGSSRPAATARAGRQPEGETAVGTCRSGRGPRARSRAVPAGRCYELAGAGAGIVERSMTRSMKP
ncbi:MAG TPA: hypothetical protein VMD59_24715, partial [Acidimicrobiales bacterium]|nr:hypothetical protein [Acidimicrobiales bacterium]